MIIAKGEVEVRDETAESEKPTIIIIDDHESVLEGTIRFLEQHYPTAKIFTAQTAQEAKEKIRSFAPDVVVMDLSLPETPRDGATAETGIKLLKNLLAEYPDLNITVQSSHIKTLVRIKPIIDSHQGGFTLADKGLSSKDMLNRVSWALQGLTHTKDLKGLHRGLEVKPEWLEVLSLAFNEGLQDKEIANRMCVSWRTVRHYWTKIQDALEVYPEEGKNIRIQTELKAREEGLID